MASLPVGAKFGFKPETFPISTPEGEYQVLNWDHFQGVLLSLQIIDGSYSYVHGSAVLVAPGVAFAARHVIEPFATQLCAEKGETSACYCYGIKSNQLIIWRCRKITFVGHAKDVVILILSYASALPPKGIFTLPVITTRIPKVGEPISMVGFSAADDKFPFDPPDVNSIRGAVRAHRSKNASRVWSSSARLNRFPV
jgi:hypothetical protein